jgi:hypothetical protein
LGRTIKYLHALTLSFRSHGSSWQVLLALVAASGFADAVNAADNSLPMHQNASPVWVTWRGTEADKGASAWFLTRFVRRDIRIREVEPGLLDLGTGEPFDVPQANFRRRHQSSVYEQLLQTFPVEDPIVRRIGEILRDIEINLWRPKKFAESALIQKATVALAEKRGDNWIPLDCYIAWFDSIYVQMKARGTLDSLPEFPSLCTSKK